MTGEWWVSFLLSTVRSATPLIFCAMAVLLAERAGVLNIGVEGAMLGGALAGILGTIYGGSAWLGVLATMVTGILVGLTLAYMTVRLPTDQVSVGIVLNLTMLGLTSFIFRVEGEKAQAIVAGVTTQIFGLSPFTVVALLLAVGIWWFLFRTGPGLKLRSAGESTHGAEAAGVNVLSLRIIVLVVAGVLSALGGAALTLGWVRSFSDNVTMGRAFIALAAVYCGRWNPILATLATLIFGAGEALAYRAQAAGSSANAFYYLMLPYVLTLLAVGLTGQARGPADAGKPYIRR
ncbi:MAG: ABC transporter permease [Thermoanaerobacteraceae bacterium]|nr:ABC transporter permease [Thermoanaerobacteraceae bacterium]